MDTLHAPTVPSGPTRTVITNGHTGPTGFVELQRKKDGIEAELKALGAVLDSHGVGMTTPLVTHDGFPRADIDVAQIRTTRARIISLRNDYNELMANVEKFLHLHFANVDNAAENAIDGPASALQPLSLADHVLPDLEEPFAKVNSVAPGSPAERAGLKPGDEIRVFGYVDKKTDDNLAKVAECVQANEGNNVFVKVSRRTDASARSELRLTLIPRRDWGGRGMLGCHIVRL